MEPEQRDIRNVQGTGTRYYTSDITSGAILIGARRLENPIRLLSHCLITSMWMKVQESNEKYKIA